MTELPSPVLDVTKDECPTNCPFRNEPRALQPICPVPWDIPLPNQAEVAKSLYTSTVKPWQTRILILAPGRLGEELVGELVIVDLISGKGVVIHDRQELIEYTALSYTWGTPDFERPIRINGLVYPITVNLYTGLQRLRSPSEKQHWWIDAISINQHDSDQRSMQVSNMLTIFGKASEVRVWLGDNTAAEALAMDFLRLLDPVQTVTAHHGEECEDLLDTLRDGLFKLYDRPWLRRIWIRQEVWAAKVIHTQCGDGEISWAQFMSADQLSSELNMSKFPWQAASLQDRHTDNLAVLLGLTRSSPGDVVSRPEIDDQPKKALGLEEPHDIFTIIQGSTRCEASDSRDRVYASLGMSVANYRSSDEPERADGLEIVVDYSKDVSEVFRDVARYLMRREKSLWVLYLKANYGRDGGLDLPTWTPDWRFDVSFLWGRFHYQPAVWNKLKDSKSNILTIRGVIVGTIDKGTPRRWTVRVDKDCEHLGETRLAKVQKHLDKMSSAKVLTLRERYLEDRFVIVAGCLITHGNLEFRQNWDWKNGSFPYLYPKNKIAKVRWVLGFGEASSTISESPCYVSPKARPGDILVFAEGGTNALTLRPEEDTSQYTFVGVAHTGRVYEDRDDEPLMTVSGMRMMEYPQFRPWYYAFGRDVFERGRELGIVQDFDLI